MDTAKVYVLKGDKKNPESAENIIIFPGGSISVCRTSNNEYWAHIEVNKDQIITEATRESKLGEIVETRIDRSTGAIDEIENIDNVYHFAVRIKTK